MAIVFIPAGLQDLTGGQREAEVDGPTIRDVIRALDDRFPGIQQRLCDGQHLSAALQVSIDDVISTRGMYAAVGPHSRVHFIPALGGG